MGGSTPAEAEVGKRGSDVVRECTTEQVYGIDAVLQRLKLTIPPGLAAPLGVYKQDGLLREEVNDLCVACTSDQGEEKLKEDGGPL